MVRRFDEPIQVQVHAQVADASSGSAPSGSAPSGSPSAFVWRGKVYAVRAIDGQWSERRSWWREDHLAPQAAGDRRVWRVRAQVGRSGSPGVFELGSDGPDAADPWLLLRAHD